MKKALLLFAVVALGASACTQKMCPTYAKADTTNSNTVQTETQRN